MEEKNIKIYLIRLLEMIKNKDPTSGVDILIYGTNINYRKRVRLHDDHI